MKFKRYLALLGFEPTYLLFHVTYKCNAKCVTCFNWKYLNTKVDELTLEEIEKIAKNMNNLYYLTFSGGEPFLREDLPEICKIFYEQSNTRVFSIPTNAQLTKRTFEATEKILSYCPNSLVKVCLSLDGLHEVHDQIRGVKGSFANFLKTYETVKSLRKNKNLFLAINTTFCKYNEDSIKEISDFVERLDIDTLNVNFIRGNPLDNNTKNVSIEKYAKFHNYLDQKLTNQLRNPLILGLHTITSLCREIVLKNLKSERRVFNCFAGRKMLVLTPTGEVRPCELLGKSFGNLRDFDYDIKKILKLENTKKIINDIKMKKCNCTWECAIQNSLIYDVKNYPRILTKFVKEAIKRYY